jgi:hypothetical protein
MKSRPIYHILKRKYSCENEKDAHVITSTFYISEYVKVQKIEEMINYTPKPVEVLRIEEMLTSTLEPINVLRID